MKSLSSITLNMRCISLDHGETMLQVDPPVYTHESAASYLSGWSSKELSASLVLTVMAGKIPHEARKEMFTAPKAVLLAVVSDAYSVLRVIGAVVVRLSGIECGVTCTHPRDVDPAALVPLDTRTVASEGCTFPAILVVEASVVGLVEDVTHATG